MLGFWTCFGSNVCCWNASIDVDDYDCKEEGNLVLQSRVIGWSNGIWPAVLLWFIASFLTLVLGFGILGFFQAQNLWFCHLRARFPSAVSIFFQRFFFFFGFFFLGPSSCWSEVMRGKRGCSLEFMASSPVKGSNEKQQQQLVGVHVPPQAIGTVVPPTLASPPACRPWDRRDLLRRLATYKSMSWFGKPQVGRLFLGLLDVICISH